MAAAVATAVSWPLCCLSERLDGLDANDGRDDRVLKAAIAVAEELFDRLGIEPAGNLVGGCHGEGVAGNLSQAAALELIPSGLCTQLRRPSASHRHSRARPRGQRQRDCGIGIWY